MLQSDKEEGEDEGDGEDSEEVSQHTEGGEEGEDYCGQYYHGNGGQQESIVVMNLEWNEGGSEGGNEGGKE